MSVLKPTTVGTGSGAMFRLTVRSVVLLVLFSTSLAGFLDGHTRWGIKTFAAFKTTEMKSYESASNTGGGSITSRGYGTGHECIGELADMYACCVPGYQATPRLCSWSEGRCTSDDQCSGDLLCNKPCIEFRPDNINVMDAVADNRCCSMPARKGVQVGTQGRNCPKGWTKIFDRDECLFASFTLNLPIIYLDEDTTHIDDTDTIINYIENQSGKACRGVFEEDSNAYYLCKQTGTSYA